MPSAENDTLSVRPQLELGGSVAVPRRRLPDGPIPGRAAYQLVHDELMLDGMSRLNLATFVTTWMEPEATRLIAECLDKNLVDKDEYPQTAELERRCVSMLADLWHAPDADDPTGTSTSGSSRPACSAAWRCCGAGGPRRPDGAGRPNLVMGANVQVCWEKFCRYWDVEPRQVPVGDGTTHLVADRAVAALRREHDRRGRDPRLDLRRLLRAGRRDRRGARRPGRRARDRRPDPCRCGVRRLRRAVPRARPRLGLPAAARPVDQRLGPQVRAGLPRASAGWSGATRTRCPTSWSSTSTTSAATCRPSA